MTACEGPSISISVLGPLTCEMETLFLAEDLVDPFNFWWHGQIARGMHFRNELYAQVLAAPVKERQGFFSQLDRLDLHPCDVVITASSDRYAAWLNLRSPQFPLR